MKNKIILVLIIVFLIIISFNIYTSQDAYPIEEPVVDNNSNIEKEVDNLVDETLLDEVLLDKSSDIEELEVIFTNSPLSEEVIERIMNVSYKENNEIKLEDLAYVQVSHWGFDDKEYIGEIIVNEKIADQIVEIFRELHEAKFPIEKIRLIDEYNAEDDLSMLDNNSSAFCYREIAGSQGKLSNHSYGVAIDINPVQNPYVKNKIILPESGKEFLDRRDIRKGMIVEGDACYNAFKSRGWTWGGDWDSLKDYQHFEFKLD